MAKPGDFYLSLLDFFSALLPGGVTIGAAVALDVPAGLPSAVTAAFTGETGKAASFAVAAYVVGQVANSIGSMVLDALYDRLYAPGRGWLSWEAEGPHGLGIVERGAMERKRRLEDELKPLVSGPLVGGVYQAVRAYLRVASPEAFADVEKLEGEQKFFRALTVGAATVGSCAFIAGDAAAGRAACALAILFLVRYLGVRRKTILRTYGYFALREHFGSKKPATPQKQADDE